MHASFTPVVFTVDGAIGNEAKTLVATIANSLSEKWDKNYSKVMGWLRTRLSFALLRATVWCLRGSRRTWRSMRDRLEDGGALPLMHSGVH